MLTTLGQARTTIAEDARGGRLKTNASADVSSWKYPGQLSVFMAVGDIRLWLARDNDAEQ